MGVRVKSVDKSGPACTAPPGEDRGRPTADSPARGAAALRVARAAIRVAGPSVEGQRAEGMLSYT